jgi:chemotaxis protein CheX
MLGIRSDEVSEILSAAVAEVFTSMLASPVTTKDSESAGVSGPPFDGVLSFVGFTGAYAGNGSVSCSASIACDLASRFLMYDAKTVDDEVLDAIGELTNMIVGSAKNLIEDRLGPIQMSVPTSVYGKNISMRNMKTELTVPLKCIYEGGEFLVSLGLAQAAQSKKDTRTHLASAS